ncbi:DUF3710 domain-containing protein [Cellulomonas sp. KRMCY2]|uniref:DUF3710 domain-containing protein n=1 Tax=Cellulomonas sp. KRMCY2 TaxID=1304865 RepID=UPI00045E88AE|nr:DUF3710 domain-containing protein [Cellulomonas sp. KRMCY2]
MGVFRRGKRSTEDVEAVDPGTAPTADDVEDSGTAGDSSGTARAADDGGATASLPSRGPWDVSEVSEPGRRVDLGALWLPGRDGMELRMEIEKSSKIVSAAAVSLHGSALQIQVFAAPRTEGIWDEIRAEIAESVTKQGGSVDDLPGPFGRELLARLPVRTAEGRTGHRPARFIGHDGPRWFLRGVLTGRAAIDPQAATELEDLFADVVVVRGGEPRAPRDLLPLTIPGKQVPADAVATDSGVRAYDPLTRGPEITEVH